MQMTQLMIDEMALKCGTVQPELWQRPKSDQITEVISAALVFHQFALCIRDDAFQSHSLPQ